MDSEDEEEEEIASLSLQEDVEMNITEESVRQILAANGGRMLNKRLVKHFKKAIFSSSENQMTFKNIINEITIISKDAKGRDLIHLKEMLPPREPDASSSQPTSSNGSGAAAPGPSGDAEEENEAAAKAEEKENEAAGEEAAAGSPMAEVTLPEDPAPSPSGENVRERARLFNEMDERAVRERESPSRILRSATDEKACVCASGHAEEDNTISLDDVKRKWMIISARSDYQDMARFLQDHSHLAGWKNFCNGYTALHYAAKFGNVECIKLLAGRHKANVNAITQAGMTPLHLAAMFNRGPAIQLLVETYKADPNVRDYRGKLPKDYLADGNTRRLSLHSSSKTFSDVDALNNFMYLDAEETISDTVLRYISGTSVGTLRFDVSTLESTGGGTLRPGDTLGGASALRRSFRVGTNRGVTLQPEQRSISLEDSLKGSYANSMKRNSSSPVTRTMSDVSDSEYWSAEMPKARGKKHIKNQKKFASMVEEIPEEASE